MESAIGVDEASARQASIIRESFNGTVRDFVDRSLHADQTVVWARLSSTEGLPTVQDVAALIESPLVRSTAVRVVTDGVTQGPQTFAEQFNVNGKVLNDSLSALAVRQAFRDGSTLIVEDVGKWHPPVARLCNSVFNEHWRLVNAGYFLTRSRARGLPFHADEETTLVFQISGAKRWRVATYAADRLGATDVPGSATVVEVDLVPGDVLVVPPYFPHGTEVCGPDDSVHLTIGVRPFKVRDLLMEMGVSRFPRMNELHAECGTIDGTRDATVEALAAVPQGVWDLEIAKASMRLLSGGMSRGIEIAGAKLGEVRDDVSHLMWRVQVGRGYVVMFAGVFAMMDHASVAHLEALLERKRQEGLTWSQVMREGGVPKGIARVLGAAALIDDDRLHET